MDPSATQVAGPDPTGAAEGKQGKAAAVPSRLITAHSCWLHVHTCTGPWTLLCMSENMRGRECLVGWAPHTLGLSSSPPFLLLQKLCLAHPKFLLFIPVLSQVARWYGARRAPSCRLSVKVSGHELSSLDCGPLGDHRRRWSLHLAELAMTFLKVLPVQPLSLTPLP